MRKQLDRIDAYRLVDEVIEGLIRWRGLTAPHDEESKVIFDEFPPALNRVAKPDRWIAAFARRHGARIWTWNLADFARVPGLVAFDPIVGRRVDNGADPTG